MVFIKKTTYKLLRKLDCDNEAGFVGMLLVMMISVAIFSMLSSVHIYTINHARYQTKIKEAYIMQTEMENFAVILKAAYEEGKTSCTPPNCCNFNVDFALELGCRIPIRTPSPYPASRCLKSSSGREYCLVHLEGAGGSAAPTNAENAPVTTSTIPAPSPLLTDVKDKCTATPAPSPPNCEETQYTADCHNKCKELATKTMDSPQQTIYNKCCGAGVQVLNCEGNKSNCDNYEASSTLSSQHKMFCEICEMSHNSINESVFTYYVCPKDKITSCVGGIRTVASPSLIPRSDELYMQSFRLVPD